MTLKLFQCDSAMILQRWGWGKDRNYRDWHETRQHPKVSKQQQHSGPPASAVTHSLPPVPAVARSWQRQPPWWASSPSALRLPPRRSHRRGSSSASPHLSPRWCCPASHESEDRRIQQDKDVTRVIDNKHCRQSGYQGKLPILTGSSREERKKLMHVQTGVRYTIIIIFFFWVRSHVSWDLNLRKLFPIIWKQLPQVVFNTWPGTWYVHLQRNVQELKSGSVN